MKKNFTALIVLLSFNLTSCLTSLRHLATYQNIVTDNRIAGLWENGGKQILISEFGRSSYVKLFEEARKENVPFSVKDSIFTLKHYIITYREQELHYTWIAALVNIGKLSFVSLTTESCYQNIEDITPIGSSAYSFAKLEWNTGNSFQLRFLDGDYIKDIILNGKARISHEYDPLFGTFVITASVEELEKFLEKYGNDERLFKNGKTINLVRKT
ncbi:MAG: hypothetical protein ACXWCZ_11015 [Flavisolibacter sp.]